jgi:thymidylate synthase
MAQVELQLQREPLPLPKLVIKRKPPSLFDYRFEDFELVGYQAHASIKAPIAV